MPEIAPILIQGRAVGPGQPPLVVAEMSGNHNGDIERAFKLMEAAKEAGADAVKLQTYTADTLTIDHDGPDFQISGGLWDGRKLYDLYQEAHTPWDWHPALFEKGRELGLMVFSTPFDATAVDLLEDLGAPVHKVASFEAVDLALLRRIGETKKPVVLSTGMADLTEIEEAVTTLGDAGCRELILLHCVSGYPTPFDQANIRTMNDLGRRFNVPVGLSDHTHGIAVSVAAVALGACLIEKHFTLARADGGPDAAFSLEAPELAELCAGCRQAWQSLGEVDYSRTEAEKGNVIFRRSLYVVADVAAGQVLSPANVRSIRPGHGLAPRHLDAVLGKRASRALSRGQALQADMIEGFEP